MSTLIDFLTARIADDELVADHVKAPVASWASGFGPHALWTASTHDGDIVTHRGSVEATVTRVLAECEAKRRIVREAADLLDSWEHAHGDDPEQAMWPDVNRRERHQARQRLGTLAAVYADHPDYREEWKP